MRAQGHHLRQPQGFIDSVLKEMGYTNFSCPDFSCLSKRLSKLGAKAPKFKKTNKPDEGVGTKPPTPEWGLMIAENLPYIERAPLAVMGPIIGLILLGAAINMMFDD